MLFLLLNLTGKKVAKYIDTSLDWANNNEQWNPQKIWPDEEVIKESAVFSLDKAPLPFQAFIEGSAYQNDEPRPSEENKTQQATRKIPSLLKVNGA